MDAETDVPTGMPDDEPEAPPLGVPAGDEEREDAGDMPGIPEDGEPPTSG